MSNPPFLIRANSPAYRSLSRESATVSFLIELFIAISTMMIALAKRYSSDPQAPHGARRLDDSKLSEPTAECACLGEASLFFTVKRLDDCWVFPVKIFGNFNESSRRTEPAFVPDFVRYNVYQRQVVFGDRDRFTVTHTVDQTRKLHVLCCY